MPLTDAACRGAKPIGQKQELSDGRGLVLVIGTTGKKSWVVRYKDGNASRRLTIGIYDPKDPEHLALADARTKAAQAKSDLRNSVRTRANGASQAAEAPVGMTVSEAFALYMERRWGSDSGDDAHKRPRARWAWFENNFKSHIGAKVLADLTKPELKKLLRDKHTVMLEMGMTGRGIGNVHGQLSAFLGWCAKHDDLTGLEANPIAGMPKIDNGGERDRWLDRSECGWAIKAIRAVGNGFAKPLELLIRSGCRKSDIFDLTASMVVLDNDELGTHLLIPDTKNGQDLAIPLVPAMVALLPDLTSLKPDQCIWSNSSESTSNVKERIDTKMVELAGREIDSWRLHDLRTTVGTHLDAFGVDDRVIEKVLCHKEPNKAKRTYRRYGFYHEKRAALQQWNDLLDKLAK